MVLQLISCTTEIPFDPDPMEPNLIDSSGDFPKDTTGQGPMDTTGMNTDGSNVSDTTELSGCDSTIVYFENQILPILIGSCALSGCHDAASAQEDIVLDSYDNLVKQKDLVVAFDLEKSELYEKITEDDPKDRMPPQPRQALHPDQISLIAKWINQGAENSSCETLNGCDTSAVSFSEEIQPVLNTYCISCHGNANPEAGVNLSNYTRTAQVANSGKLLGVISWQDGFLKMPLGGSQIPECDIEKVGAWISQGALDN